MALSPIQIFQQQQSPLTALLQSGTTEISRVMDRAVQIGRDIANKQLDQEQDLLAMRRNETNLAQRRAENLQQDWEDTMRFVRGAYEFDQKFGADQLYRQQQVGMEQARMGQQASQFEAELGLREATGAREERRLSLAEQEFKAEQEAQQSAKANIDSLFSTAGTASSKTGVVGMGPYSMEVNTPPSPTEIYREYGNMEQVVASREATPQQKAAARGRLLELEAQLPKEGTDEKGLTPYQQAAEARRTAKDLEEAQRKEADILVKDTGAFVSPTVWVSKKYGLDTAESETELAKRQRQIPVELQSEMASYSKDPVSAEMAYALSHSTPDGYVSPPGMNLTDAQKAKRLRFWQIAHGQVPSGTAPASTGAVRRAGI